MLDRDELQAMGLASPREAIAARAAAVAEREWQLDREQQSAPTMPPPPFIPLDTQWVPV